MADAVTVGGPYVEDPDFVPNPTDMVKTFNTSGLGASGKIEEVAPVFEVDKVRTAEEIRAALDPENTTVPSSRVVFPVLDDDYESAKKRLLAAADARIEQGVEIGGPTPAERAAADEGTDGLRAESGNSDAPLGATADHDVAVSGARGETDGNPEVSDDAKVDSTDAKTADGPTPADGAGATRTADPASTTPSSTTPATGRRGRN